MSRVPELTASKLDSQVESKYALKSSQCNGRQLRGMPKSAAMVLLSS